VSSPELAHAAFFSPGVAPEEVARHFSRLQQESFRFELEAMFLDRPHPKKVRTPILVLAAADDRVFSVAEEQATARAYHTEAEVFPDMAHDMMLDQAGRRWPNESSPGCKIGTSSRRSGSRRQLVLGGPSRRVVRDGPRGRTYQTSGTSLRRTSPAYSA
jgi:dienelactone hydrolase